MFYDESCYLCIYKYGKHERTDYSVATTDFPYLEALLRCLSVLLFPCDVIIIVPETFIGRINGYTETGKNAGNADFQNLLDELRKQMDIHHVRMFPVPSLS